MNLQFARTVSVCVLILNGEMHLVVACAKLERCPDLIIFSPTGEIAGALASGVNDRWCVGTAECIAEVLVPKAGHLETLELDRDWRKGKIEIDTLVGPEKVFGQV